MWSIVATPHSVDASMIPRPDRQRGRSPVTDRILILDFGSQVTQLIARRVRESGVDSAI